MIADAPTWSRRSPARNEPRAEEAASGAHRIVVGVVSRVAQGIGQPLVLAAAMVVLLIIAMVWQHPIARLIGTESLPPAPLIATPVIAPAAAITPTTVSPGRAWHAVYHGTARDPFRPLVSANGSMAAPVALRPAANNASYVAHHPDGSPHHPVSARPPQAGGCRATHVVRVGESLWSISEGLTHRNRPSNLPAAWRALYAANRATVGPNPSLLLAGERLCLPPIRDDHEVLGSDTGVL